MAMQATAAPAAFSAYAAGPESALVGSISRLGPRTDDGPAGVTINLNVTADATTDPVALGDTLLKTINKSLSARGQKKLATR